MGLVQAAWEGGRVGEVLKLLNQEKADNPDLCGFEWNYWMRQCHQDVRTLNIKGLGLFSSFSAEGTRIASIFWAERHAPRLFVQGLGHGQRQGGFLSERFRIPGRWWDEQPECRRFAPCGRAGNQVRVGRPLHT